MRISDLSSDVCSSDLSSTLALDDFHHVRKLADHAAHFRDVDQFDLAVHLAQAEAGQNSALFHGTTDRRADLANLDSLAGHGLTPSPPRLRSEEHTSELQSLMRISYAVFCLKKKINQDNYITSNNITIKNCILANYVYAD